MHKPKQPRVVVVGSSNTDLVVVCPQLPSREATTVTGGEFRRFAGGKGANQAVAAARAGATVTFVGGHGADEFGRAAKAGLAAEGIDTHFFRVKAGRSSGIALIMVGGRTRENIIAVAKSANNALTAADVAAATAPIRTADVVVAQLEIPVAAVVAAARLARRHGVPFVLNAAPAQPLPRSLFRLVHTLVPNADEAATLTGEEEPGRAAQKLLAWGCQQVVITLGARGAMWAIPGATGAVKAPKVRPVDTVGAGDCFVGWLATGLAEGLSLSAAVQQAVRAAALAVTRPGAQAGMPWRREVGDGGKAG